MSVDAVHKQYAAKLKSWNLVNDCIKGSETIKKKGKVYLPMPNTSDDSKKNEEAYEAYKLRANFVNFVGYTKKGMLGMVFRKDTEIELPSELEYLESDSNGNGLTLDQSIRSATGKILETARHGLLVDYPETKTGLTKAEEALLNNRANILKYEAGSILNWRTSRIGSVVKLSLVVLKEEVEEVSSDGFSVDTVDRYRVLRLDETTGTYQQQLYKSDGTPDGDPKEPKDNKGSTFKEIPFTFIGSENNDENVDNIPLYDLAEINLAHYRNSADYEESSFLVGQPTPVIAGLTQSWVNEVLKGKVFLGSRTALLLPEGGLANLLQAEPNSMPLEGMKEKETQMMRIGARLIQDNTGVETAEAAKIRFAGQNSDLAVIVKNIQSAYLKCFKWCTMFMGGAEEYTLKINTEFYDKSLTAQQIMAFIQLADRGDITQEVIRDNLRKAGLISNEVSNEDLDEANENKGSGLKLEDDSEESSVLIEILLALTSLVGGKVEEKEDNI